MNWKALLVLFFAVAEMAFAAAQCNSAQIDINSASLSELQKIKNIGPVYAQDIIDARPFSSVDELVNIKGIADKKLAGIKQQGLACVANDATLQENISILSNSSVQSNSGASASETIAMQAENQNPSPPAAASGSPTNSGYSAHSKSSNAPIIPQVIALNPQRANSINASATKKDYSIRANPAIYGFIAFSVVLGLLFAAKKFRIKRYKSEFD